MTRERQNHEEQDSGVFDKSGASVLAAETLRRTAEPPPKTEERISLFWRVFGGTLLSIVALVVITVYNQFSSTLTDLRKEVNQLYEARAELLRKDEFNTRLTSVWAGMKDIQTVSQGLATLAERAKALEQQLERQTRNAEEDRKEEGRKIEEQRKAGDEERKEICRKLEEQRKAAEMDRAELTRQFNEERRTGEDERRELRRKLEALAERLAKVQARQVSKTKAPAPTGN